MKVQIMQNKWDKDAKKNVSVALKLENCSSDVAEVVPYFCKNDDFNRKLQRQATGKELPNEMFEPYLEFAPGRSLAWPTAEKFGIIVDVETGNPVTLKDIRQ